MARHPVPFPAAAIAYDGTLAGDGHGFQAHVGPMRSKSRGFGAPASTDPFDKPRIRFNYMSHEDDWAEMRAGVRLTREIFAQPHSTLIAGASAAGSRDRQRRGHRCLHPRAGGERLPSLRYLPDRPGRRSARGGRSGTRVIGIEGLRIADTSVMPTITTGNLNAPAIMIGEKAADMILGRPPLPASNAPSYVAPDWETKQR